MAKSDELQVVESTKVISVLGGRRAGEDAVLSGLPVSHQEHGNLVVLPPAALYERLGDAALIGVRSSPKHGDQICCFPRSQELDLGARLIRLNRKNSIAVDSLSKSSTLSRHGDNGA